VELQFSADAEAKQADAGGLRIREKEGSRLAEADGALSRQYMDSCRYSTVSLHVDGGQAELADRLEQRA